MASLEVLPITLPPLPASWSKPSPSKPSAPTSLQVYPAGPSYISAARRQILQRTFAQDDEATLASHAARQADVKANGEEDLYPGLGEEEESATVLACDPKEWKKQDHYAILGLGGLRYTANDEQIKVARESASEQSERGRTGVLRGSMCPRRGETIDPSLGANHFGPLYGLYQGSFSPSRNLGPC